MSAVNDTLSNLIEDQLGKPAHLLLNETGLLVKITFGQMDNNISSTKRNAETTLKGNTYLLEAANGAFKKRSAQYVANLVTGAEEVPK